MLTKIIGFLDNQIGRASHRKLRYPQLGSGNKCGEIRRVANLLLDGFDAALHTGPIELIQQIAGLEQAEARVVYEGAFAARSSLCLKAESSWTESAPYLTGIEPLQNAIIGLGYGAATSQLGLPPMVRDTDEYWIWMALDAYGFNRGFLKWNETIARKEFSLNLPQQAQHAFDQGLGRSLWVGTGARIASIATLIQEFSPERRADLWSGAALMMGYWGAMSEKELKLALKMSGNHAGNLRQGIALAALLRSTSGTVPDHTSGASEIICNMHVNELVNLSAQLASQSNPNSARDFFLFQGRLISMLGER